MEPIERRRADDLSAETFVREYLSRDRPVIVTGAMTALAAMNQWRIDMLATRYGDLMMSVAKDEKVTTTSAVVTMASFLEQLGVAQPRWVYAFQDVSQDPVRFGALWDAFDVPGFVNLPKREACVVSRFYIGAAGQGVAPHAHSETINFLAEGSKEWILHPNDAAGRRFAEDYFAHRYPRGEHAQWFRETVPRRDLSGWTCVQEPGEILFVPREVYHATLNRTHTVGLTWRWDGSKAPPRRCELPATIDLEGVALDLVGQSDASGAIIGLFRAAESRDKPVSDRSFVVKLIAKERERALLLLGELCAHVPREIATQLMEESLYVAGFSELAMIARADGTLQIGDAVFDSSMRQALVDALFGETCFNETIRRDLLGSVPA